MSKERSDNNNSNDNDSFEVSELTSTRVCKHMNDDHSVTVYAMARNMVDPLPKEWKLSDAKLKKVTANGCHLQAITCSGDMCQVKNVVYPFVPPLTAAAQVKPRLVEIHHQVLAPQMKWIYAKPLALKLTITVALLAYATLFMGVEGMKARMDQSNLIKTFYPQTGYIAMALQAVFYLTIVAHVAEASFAAHTCRSAFKLNWKGTIQWAALILIVGFPILNELTALQAFQQKKLREAESNDQSKKES